jgi:activating signal cointegrator complex subunit 2
MTAQSHSIRALPPFAPFPPAKFRRELVPEEWEACLDSWITLAQSHLRLPARDFSAAIEKDQAGLLAFLSSYFEDHSDSLNNPPLERPEKTSILRKDSFLLAHRLLSEPSFSGINLQWTFLADFCRAYPRSLEIRKLFSNIWKRKGTQIEEGLQKIKILLIMDLDSGKMDLVEPNLTRLTPLLHASHAAAVFFMVGSDLLDSLVVVYQKANPAQRKVITLFTYLGLVSLVISQTRNFSLLSDHLYSMKSSTPSASDHASLLSDLITNTPLLTKLAESTTNDAEVAKTRKLEQTLVEFQKTSTARPKRPIRRKLDKGKEKITEEYDHGDFGNVHVHRMSLITQVQDLFPDLSAVFVMKLLDEYNEDVEQVTVHLLENSLPEHLRTADRCEQLPKTSKLEEERKLANLIPRSSPTLERRNIFDNDEFDQLAVDASRMHLGRKNAKLTADDVLADRATAPNKAAILSALANFDSDDDERDDTYDVEDVGGTVDSTFGGNGDADVDKNEEALFMAYRLSPDTFKRDSGTRREKARLALRSETGMTDEAIEGWAIMTLRDPRKLRRLEAKYATFGGQQRELERTSYRESPADSGTEDDVHGGFPTGRGRGRGRGRGGFSGARGGNVAGPASEKDTQQARHRKEAGKGSRANHNRRDQRARKMARGAFPG